MSDNEDLLADDLGDHSLADYNLGNDEEDQLLADDYESGPQNVPTSIDPSFNDGSDISSSDFSGHSVPYSQQSASYQPPTEECVVPNITVEVPNTPVPTYAPYQPPVYQPQPEIAVVPPAIPAAPVESPQIVPSELSAPNGEGRDRFPSERPVGAARTPQLRDIPDSLDKVFVPRGGFVGRGRTSWRNPQFQPRTFNHPYRRHNVHRGNFLQQRPVFPARPPAPRPDQIRSDQIRPETVRPDQIRPDAVRPEQMRPEPDIRLERPPFQNFQRFYRPTIEPRPNFEPRFFRPFHPREITPNINQVPQITIRQPVVPLPPKVLEPEFGPKREPEVRMLPVQLPPNLPPGGLAGKKVLINPHFKGNFQPPVDGVPTYIPTRIQKSPPPPLEPKFGPITDIDDAAERFIAEQRNALARAAGRKLPRRSPQRYIENTTIEIENELAPEATAWRGDDDLLRRQEEFIHANRAGLRRRMRSPSPARSPPPAPRRSPPPPERRRAEPERRPRRARSPPTEESEYKRRVREQESLRERVLRAKEVRRRKNAVALTKQLQERERESKDKPEAKEKIKSPRAPSPDKPTTTRPELPDTTRSPEREPENVEKAENTEKTEKTEQVRERSPVKEAVEVNSTCENLTPPRSPRALTPPLPQTERRYSDDDDDLAFILGDIDDILSDDEDSGRFKSTESTKEPPKPKPPTDLRSKLPPKNEVKRPPRQKIVFTENKEQKKKNDKSPPAKKPAVTSSTKTDVDVDKKEKITPTKQQSESSANRSRPRIVFEKKEPEKEKEDKSKPAPTRRVVLQRKITQTKEKSVFARIEVQSDPTKPNPGIFSRAFRTAIGSENSRIVVKRDEPEIQYDSSDDEDKLLNEEIGMVANVSNLPHGITDTRLKTLAGNEVQSLVLDKEERSAKISFKTTVAAAAFRRKFDGKMVAASRLTVTLR